MPLVYPLVALCAFVVYVAAILAGVALWLLVPALVIVVLAALVSLLQWPLAIRLVPAAVRLCTSPLIFVAALARASVTPLVVGDVQGPSGGHARHSLPQTFAFVDEVARAMRTRGVDRILVSVEANAAVYDDGVQRFLVLGLPLLYATTPDQLRAVIGHELAHFVQRSSLLNRACFRALHSMENASEVLMRLPGGVWSPLYWAARLPTDLLHAIYLPWRRSLELQADRMSAAYAGANHALAMLRAFEERIPAASAALELVVAGARQANTAPTHLWEAAARLGRKLPVQVRARVRQASVEDVLDFRGHLHPPLALRRRALAGLPDRPATDTRVSAAVLPDLRAIEESFTKDVFRLGVRYVAAAEFSSLVAVEPPTRTA